MKNFIYLCLIALCLSENLISFPKEKNLTVLTDYSINEAQDLYKNIFLIVYAPWCQISKSRLPLVESLAPVIEKEFKNIKVAKMDGSTNRVTCRNYGINGYPTIILLSNGKHMGEYTGRIEKDSAIQWIQEKIGPFIHKAESAQDFENISKKNTKIPVVTYFGNEKEEVAVFEKIANEEKNNYLFAQISSSKLIKEKNAKQNSIKIYKPYDEKENTFDGKITYNSVKQFLKKFGHKKIADYDTEIKRYIFEENNDGLFFVYDKEKPKIVEKVADQTRGLLQTVLVEKSSTLGKELIEAAKVEVPAIIIYDLGIKPKQIVIPKPKQNHTQTAEEVVDFIKKWEKSPAGVPSTRISKYLKKGVIQIKKTNFKDIVLDSDDDVFVKYYVSWCGFCRQLAPIYEDLAREMEDYEHLKIGEVNIEEEGRLGERAQGFPTLILYPKGKKDKPIYYEGSRTVENMKNFLIENAGNPIK